MPEEQFRVGSAPQQAAAHSYLTHTKPVMQAKQVLHILSGKGSKTSMSSAMYAITVLCGP